MILNNRQTAILYELLEKNDFISYEYLTNRFFATEKTIRTDIKKLNDFLNNDDGKIILKKGKGFKLNCNIEKRENLRENFSARYCNSDEIIRTYNKKDLQIYNCLSKGYVKIDELTHILASNNKSISLELKDIRNNLNKYNCSLNSKPYKGMIIDGDEIHIRSAFIDSASFQIEQTIDGLFYDGAKHFEIEEVYIKNINNIFLNACKKYNFQISQFAIIKLVTCLVVAQKRHDYGFNVLLSDYCKKVVDSFCYKNIFLEIIGKVEELKGTSFDNDEIYYFIAYGMVLSDFNDDKIIDNLPDDINAQVKELKNLIINSLEINHIATVSQDEFFVKTITISAYEIILRKTFGFIEKETSNTIKNIVYASPMCCAISAIVYDDVVKYCKFDLGDYVLCRLAIGIYSGIRYVTRTVKLANVAIYSPDYRSLVFSTVDRIKYHCNQFIENIDIFTASDLAVKNLSKYDLLLTIDDSEPIGFNADIEKLKISFFCTMDDIDTIYTKLSVMTRSYKNSFSSLKKIDVLDISSQIKEVKDIDAYIRNLVNNDEDVIKQAKCIQKYNMPIQNSVLPIIVFTDKKENQKARVILTSKPITHQGYKFDRIILFANKTDNSTKVLKTSESILRLIYDHISSNNNYNIDEIEDFYDYYIQIRNR